MQVSSGKNLLQLQQKIKDNFGFRWNVSLHRI